MFGDGVLQRFAERVSHPTRKALESLAQDLRSVAERQKRSERTIKEIADAQQALRVLMQARSDTASPRPEAAGRLAGPPVPLELVAGSPNSVRRDADLALTALHACPSCGFADRTLVCEYNKSIAIDVDLEEELRRYDYAVCHGCGITYATLRPTGDTFRYLFERFDENLGRLAHGGRRNPLLSPTALSDDERRSLEVRLERGVWVSEHLGLHRSEHISQLMSDRLSNSPHVEILSSLLPIDRWSVLEVRPRFGSILAALQRVHCVKPYALPMTDAQRLVVDKICGIESPELIDFDTFRIPFERSFDLIIANHMFTHVLRPADFFGEVAAHLRQGGFVYLYNEPDDGDFLDGPMGMFNSMVPFHMQTFDQRSMVRSLEAHGLEPLFVGHVHGKLVYLGSLTGLARHNPIPHDELAQRVSAYRDARDLAILRLPESQRWRFRDEWSTVVQRCVANGLARFDDSGHLRIVRRSSEPLAE